MYFIVSYNYYMYMVSNKEILAHVFNKNSEQFFLMYFSNFPLIVTLYIYLNIIKFIYFIVFCNYYMVSYKKYFTSSSSCFQ